MRTPLVLLVAALVLFASAPPARAHGEAAQEAFLRTQTATFFDVTFSRSSLRVGEPVVLAGKVKLLRSWPTVLPKPEVGYLSVNVPGPTFLLKDRRVGGRFIPQSMNVARGAAYEFRMTLVARRPGRWHVHPVLAVEGAGTLVGPGRWVEVVPGGAFRNPITLATGAEVDLEHYGTANVLIWHLVTLVIGGLWILWWLVPRPLLQRVVWTHEGAEERLITPLDRKISYLLGAATLVALVVGNVWTRVSHSETIPQQVYRIEAPRLSLPPPSVSATVTEATYDPRTEEVSMILNVENRGSLRTRITAFATSTVTFASDGRGRSLELSPDGTIEPGKIEAVTLKMRAPVWREQHLVETGQAQIAIAGLLFLEGEEGRSDFVEVHSFIVPRFDSEA